MIGTSLVPSDDVCHLEVNGELDMLTTPGMVDAALAPRGTRDLVIELTGVTFIDATGLGGLITVRAGLATTGRQLCIVGASPRVIRTFALGRAEFLLKREPRPPDPRILNQLAAAVVDAVRAAPRIVRLGVGRPELAVTP